MSEFISSINWWYVGAAFAAYVVIGILWATWKWRQLSHANFAEYKQKKITYPTSRIDVNDYIPRVRKNKARITGWMAFWPFNAPYDIFKYVLFDLIVDFWNYIYESLAAYFTSVTRSAFKEDYIDDKEGN